MKPNVLQLPQPRAKVRSGKVGQVSGPDGEPGCRTPVNFALPRGKKGAFEQGCARKDGALTQLSPQTKPKGCLRLKGRNSIVQRCQIPCFCAA